MENVIITIARQHGSGGRLIGECLAKKMGIAYYDKELISLTAKENRVCPGLCERGGGKANCQLPVQHLCRRHCALGV